MEKIFHERRQNRDLLRVQVAAEGILFRVVSVSVHLTVIKCRKGKVCEHDVI